MGGSVEGHDRPSDRAHVDTSPDQFFSRHVPLDVPRGVGAQFCAQALASGVVDWAVAGIRREVVILDDLEVLARRVVLGISASWQSWVFNLTFTRHLAIPPLSLSVGALLMCALLYRVREHLPKDPERLTVSQNPLALGVATIFAVRKRTPSRSNSTASHASVS
jgi:hypothetical protein